MKTLITTLAILLFAINTQSQTNNINDTWYISVGVDPAVLSGSHFLAKDGKRVEAGSLNYIIQLGMENYQPKKIGFKWQLRYESFKNIHFKSYGFYGGITYDPLIKKIPFTNIDLHIGDYWYLQAGTEIINRKGLQQKKYFNLDTYRPWALGLNFGIVYTTPKIKWLDIKLPFDLEFQLNYKDRPVNRLLYTKRPANIKDMKLSGYILIKKRF